MENQYPTIRELARTRFLPEYRLRCMLRQGKLPGFYVGNRFKVNLPLLIEQINRESLHPDVESKNGTLGGRITCE